MGGSGDYFADADTVIVMDNYTPSDQTAAAHSIAAQHVATLAAAGVQQLAPAAGGAAAVWVTPRAPLRVYAGPEDSRGVKTHVRSLHHIQVWPVAVVGLCGLAHCADSRQTAMHMPQFVPVR
jgi:hypothetical protein